MKLKLIVVAATCLLVGSGCVRENVPQQKMAPDQNQSQPATPGADQVTSAVRAGKWGYITRVHDTSGTSKYGDPIKDTELARADQEEATSPEVLVERLGDLAKSLEPQDKDKYVPHEHYIFRIQSVIEERYVVLEQDNGVDGFNVYRPLWLYDLTAKKLRRLNAITELSRPFYKFVSSPDSRYIAAAIEEDATTTNICSGLSRKLLLLDVVNDTVKTIATVGKNETLNARYCGYQGFGQDFVWLNNREIEYKVFDQTKAVYDENATEVKSKPEVATRKVKI